MENTKHIEPLVVRSGTSVAESLHDDFIEEFILGSRNRQQVNDEIAKLLQVDFMTERGRLSHFTHVYFPLSLIHISEPTRPC